MAKEDKFEFARMLADLKKAQVDVPNDLAETGQLYFQRNFDRAQWDGKAWAPRKRETKATLGHALLVNTGRLRQAMQNTVREKTWKVITWGVDVPYAEYLNFGTNKMPTREFLGESKELNDTLFDKLKKRIDAIMKV